MNKVFVRNVNDPVPTIQRVNRKKLLVLGHIGVVTKTMKCSNEKLVDSGQCLAKIMFKEMKDGLTNSQTLVRAFSCIFCTRCEQLSGCRLVIPFKEIHDAL